jgi:hypothetical protein
MRILYKLTTRSRPKLAERAIRSVIDNSVSDDYRIFVTLDVEDESDYSAIKNLPNVDLCYAKGAGSKIASINRDLDLIKDMFWDILVNLSDDQVFIKKGFDEDIRKAFKYGYWNPLSPDENVILDLINLDQFIHFPDGNQKDLSTMSIMGRDYFNRDKFIYHPSYSSVYCDNEAQEVAQIRDCYRFVDEHIFNHLHPAWGKAQNDAQYLKTEHPSVYNADHMNYEKRKANNFKD